MCEDSLMGRGYGNFGRMQFVVILHWSPERTVVIGEAGKLSQKQTMWVCRPSEGLLLHDNNESHWMILTRK